jgi:hypothetical protein
MFQKRASKNIANKKTMNKIFAMTHPFVGVSDLFSSLLTADEVAAAVAPTTF